VNAERDDTVRALTRPGADGSVAAAVTRWWRRRRYRSQDFPIARLTALRASRTTVIIPVRECAQTIGAVLERAVAPARRAGLVDEVVVVEAASRDGSARVAAAHGARVLQQDDLDPELGPALGKGDAMWRALAATGGEIVCFMDGDTADPDPAHLLGLLGPLLSDPALAMVKGAFERPFDTGSCQLVNEGGRVTELMARPLINLHAPLLAGFAQPLAGEFAARRELLEELSFPVGYGVETATLLDALTLRELDALAECHLGGRQNRHQPLRSLGEMAYAVLAAFERRLDADGSLTLPAGAEPAGRYVRPWQDGATVAVPVAERPPLYQRRAAASVRRSGS
jgi:glucosyl-3-phosphoglycerate synthase